MVPKDSGSLDSGLIRIYCRVLNKSAMFVLPRLTTVGALNEILWVLFFESFTKGRRAVGISVFG